MKSWARWSSRGSCCSKIVMAIMRSHCLRRIWRRCSGTVRGRRLNRLEERPKICMSLIRGRKTTLRSGRRKDFRSMIGTNMMTFWKIDIGRTMSGSKSTPIQDLRAKIISQNKKMPSRGREMVPQERTITQTQIFRKRRLSAHMITLNLATTLKPSHSYQTWMKNQSDCYYLLSCQT